MTTSHDDTGIAPDTFRISVERSRHGELRGTAGFIGPNDHEIITHWEIGPKGFGAWKTSGHGIAPTSAIGRGLKTRVSALAEREPRDVPDIETQSHAHPFTDVNGIVHVPHHFPTIAKHTARNRSDDHRPGRDDHRPGRDAYLTYADARGWTLPRWDELHESEQRAWNTVHDETARQLSEEHKRGHDALITALASAIVTIRDLNCGYPHRPSDLAENLKNAVALAVDNGMNLRDIDCSLLRATNPDLAWPGPQ